MPSRTEKLFYAALRIDRLRFLLCRARWRMLRGKLRFHSAMDSAVGDKTISHNLGAFDNVAAFGMARRMSLLLFPTAAILKDRLADARVLIVGPRTEDDIFWARALGLYQTRGLDLFSYSPMIDVGDIHASGLPDESYDAVLLAWMISYSSEPKRVVTEALRILKPGGLLGIGIESNMRQKIEGVSPPRMNALNSPADLAALVDLPMVFNNDPMIETTYDCGVVFRKSLTRD